MRFQPFLKPIVSITAISGLGYLIVTTLFSSAIRYEKVSRCLSNLRQISLAYAQYAQDSDGVSLPISRSNQGWADLLQPYAKTWKVFQCPAGTKTSKLRRTDYFYNARLANLRYLPYPRQTILFGDGYDNSGANAHLSELPLDWKNDENSDENRHWLAFNFVFVDGHVKQCRPQKISTEAPKRGGDSIATFAVR